MDKLIPPFLDQHAADLIAPGEYRMLEDARRFENWEQYFAGKAALGVAIDYAMDWGLTPICDRVFSLAETLRARLSEVDGVRLTDQGQVKCGIVTFEVTQADAYQVKSELHKRKINVSVSDGSGTLVSFQQRGIERVIRSSVHYFNTTQELDIFIDALREVLASNR